MSLSFGSCNQIQQHAVVDAFDQKNVTLKFPMKLANQINFLVHIWDNQSFHVHWLPNCHMWNVTMVSKALPAHQLVLEMLHEG